MSYDSLSPGSSKLNDNADEQAIRNCDYVSPKYGCFNVCMQDVCLNRQTS